MVRTVAHFALSLLLTAVLLWGGCVSCAQYFQFTASHGCCNAGGHCRRAPAAKTCSIQPMEVPAAAHFTAPALAMSAPVPAPPAAVVMAPGEASPVQASPPDLCQLYSVFRI